LCECRDIKEVPQHALTECCFTYTCEPLCFDDVTCGQCFPCYPELWGRQRSNSLN